MINAFILCDLFDNFRETMQQPEKGALTIFFYTAHYTHLQIMYNDTDSSFTKTIYLYMREACLVLTHYCDHSLATSNATLTLRPTLQTFWTAPTSIIFFLFYRSETGKVHWDPWVGHGVTRWWPPFWGFHSDWVPMLYLRTIRLTPSFCRKNRVVSITFSSRDTRS